MSKGAAENYLAKGLTDNDTSISSEGKHHGRMLMSVEDAQELDHGHRTHQSSGGEPKNTKLPGGINSQYNSTKKRRVYSKVEKELVINADQTGGRKERLRVAALLGMPARTSDTLLERYRKDPGAADDRRRDSVKRTDPELVSYCRAVMDQSPGVSARQVRARINQHVLAKIVNKLGVAPKAVSTQDSLEIYLTHPEVARKFTEEKVRQDKTVAQWMYETSNAKQGWIRANKRAKSSSASLPWQDSVSTQASAAASSPVTAAKTANLFCPACNKTNALGGESNLGALAGQIMIKIKAAEKNVNAAEQDVRQAVKRAKAEEAAMDLIESNWPDELENLLAHLSACQQAVETDVGSQLARDAEARVLHIAFGSKKNANLSLPSEEAPLATAPRLIADWRKQRKKVLDAHQALGHAKSLVLTEKATLKSIWDFWAAAAQTGTTHTNGMQNSFPLSNSSDAALAL